MIDSMLKCLIRTKEKLIPAEYQRNEEPIFFINGMAKKEGS